MSQIGNILEQSLNPGEKAHLGEIITLTDQKQERKLSAENRNSMSRWHRGEDDVVGSHSLFTFNTALYTSPVNNIAGIGGSTGLGKLSEEMERYATSGMLIAGLHELKAAQRMTPEELDYIEDLIDAEYVPFSFHDVRTNEIISLPAFVSNIQDDFNAEYGSSHGFGRTDPVYAYSKTTRQIGLTFTLVAQNAPDHEYMWYIINRLIAMLYPQRDSGLKRFMEDGKPFVQPFSQAVAASPLVRLRLGDTIGSNSSGRAMERIFGGKEVLQSPPDLAPEDTKEFAGAMSAMSQASQAVKGDLIECLNWSFKNSDAATMADGTYAGAPAVKPEEIVDLGASIIDTPIVLPKGAIVAFTKDKDPGAFPTFPPDTDKLGINYFAVRYPVSAVPKGLIKVGTKANTDRNTKNPDTGKYEPEVWDTYGWVIELGEITDEAQAMALGGEPFVHYFRKMGGSSGFPPPFPPPDGPYIIVPRDTKIEWKLTDYTNEDAVNTHGGATLQEKYKTMWADATAGMEKFAGGRTMEEVGEFVSDANPLVKAFKSSGGRGLAGFITQMSLGYSDKLWGTSFEAGAHGRSLRAPKAVDITIQFNPVHDFPLGLDEFGQMFAPSHPVGAQSAKNLNEYETAAEKLEKWKANAERKVTFLPPVDE